MEQAHRLPVIPVCFTYSGENKLSTVPIYTDCQGKNFYDGFIAVAQRTMYQTRLFVYKMSHDLPAKLHIIPL